MSEGERKWEKVRGCWGSCAHLKEREDVGVVLGAHLRREAAALVEAADVHVEGLVVAAVDVHATRACEHVPVRECGVRGHDG